MARGDYSVRVAASTSDEVGQLAEAFNSMAQDLAEVDQLHRDIVANVSHELRTPVAALRARLENMADGVEEPSRENLDAAVRQSEHLTELLQYLLDLSRLDAGVAGLDVREVGVADLLDSAIDVARLAALQNGRGVNFSTHIDPVDLRIHGDPARLMQVLVNVLDNATRHTPDGSTVHVDAGRQRGPGADRHLGRRAGHRDRGPRAGLRAVPARHARIGARDGRHGHRARDRALGGRHPRRHDRGRRQRRRGDVPHPATHRGPRGGALPSRRPGALLTPARTSLLGERHGTTVS
jgi:Signal transduction histidine kinase